MEGGTSNIDHDKEYSPCCRVENAPQEASLKSTGMNCTGQWTWTRGSVLICLWALISVAGLICGIASLFNQRYLCVLDGRIEGTHQVSAWTGPSDAIGFPRLMMCPRIKSHRVVNTCNQGKSDLSGNRAAFECLIDRLSIQRNGLFVAVEPGWEQYDSIRRVSISLLQHSTIGNDLFSTWRGEAGYQLCPRCDILRGGVPDIRHGKVDWKEYSVRPEMQRPSHLYFGGYPSSLLHMQRVLSRLCVSLRSSRLFAQLRQLFLQNIKLFGSGCTGVSGVLSSLNGRPVHISGLAVHLPPLVVNEEPGNASSQQGEAPNRKTSPPKRYGSLLETAKFPTFNRRYKEWVLSVRSVAIAVLVLRISGSLVLLTGWNDWIGSRYFNCFGRRMSDRERVLISLLCVIVAVAVCFHLFCALVIVPHNSFDSQ